MRKLFVLTLAAMVAIPFYAAKVYQNVWGGSLELSNDEFQPHQESLFANGQTLRLTFVNNSGWMQVFHKDGNNGWSSTDLVSGLDLSAGYVEVNLSSTAVSEIQSFGGLYIKGANVTLKSVDLIYDDNIAPEWDATSIWTGTLTAGHEEMSEETNIDASYFAIAKVGQKIRFHFSENDGEGYFQMSAVTKNSGWNTLPLTDSSIHNPASTVVTTSPSNSLDIKAKSESNGEILPFSSTVIIRSASPS